MTTRTPVGGCANVERTVYDALPRLPTYNFAELHERGSHARASYCTVLAGGVRSVRDNAATAPAAAASHGGTTATAAAEEGCGIPVHVLLQHFPTWRTLDDKVLRFFGYHVEQVCESTVEQWRVRKVKLHYHLADGTLSITETPAEANSGLRRGVTVARHRPAAEDGVDVYTLCVGGTLTCRGVQYTLVDCDAATRTFYDVLGMPQPLEPLPYPCDAFAAAATATAAQRTHAARDEEHAVMRRVVEAQAAVRAGTHSSLLTPAERVKAHSFYAHDGEVLRFYATWRRRRFRVCYHVADDTISVLFDDATHDGYDRHAMFLRRGRVPRTPAASSTLTGGDGAAAAAAQPQLETLRPPRGVTPVYVTRDDLFVGADVTLYGRTFFLYDCDDYTRAQLQRRRLPANALPCPLPAGDADGGSGRHGRAARQARHDAAADVKTTMTTQQQQQYADEVFRFRARLAQPRCGDADRLFVLCYYVGDATASLHEVPQAKGGGVACAGGVVCARRTLHARAIAPPLTQTTAVGNTAHGDNNNDGDEATQKAASGGGECAVVALLVPGARLTLDGVTYVLCDADAHTRTCRAMGVPEAVSDDDARATTLLARARDVLRRRFEHATEAFRAFATLRLARDGDVVAVGLSCRDVRTLLMATNDRATVTDEVLGRVMQRIGVAWPPHCRPARRATKADGDDASDKGGSSSHSHAARQDNDDENDDDDGDGAMYVPLDAFTEHLMGEPFASQVPQRCARADATAAMLSRTRTTAAVVTTAHGSADGGAAATRGVVPRGVIRTAEAQDQGTADAAAAEAALRTLLLRSEARRTLLLQSLRATAADTYDGNIGVDDLCTCVTQRVGVALRDDELQALVRKFYYTEGVTHWQARRLPLSELRRLIML